MISTSKHKKISAVEEDCINTTGCRRAIWLFLHTEVKDSPCLLRYSERYEMFTICLVVYLVLADIIVSIPEVASMSKESSIYKDLSRFIYAVFTVEYVMRLWSCMESKALSRLGSIRGRLKLMRGVMEMVDLVVLVAFYISFIPAFHHLQGFQALRMVRLLRVMALLKVERKANSFGSIVSVLKTKKSELMATVFTALVLMLMSATTIYYLETESQPEAFPSVPSAMWWSVISLTTVGYGDVVPITAAGKLLGCIVAFFGVGLFALPAGILGSGFVEEVNKAKERAAREEDSEGEDETEEILGKQEIEVRKIQKLTEDAKETRETVDEMQSNQRDLVNLLNTMCPALEIPMPTIKRRADDATRKVTDKDLAALQQSVIVKLDTLKRSKNSRQEPELSCLPPRQQRNSS